MKQNVHLYLHYILQYRGVAYTVTIFFIYSNIGPILYLDQKKRFYCFEGKDFFIFNVSFYCSHFILLTIQIKLINKQH